MAATKCEDKTTRPVLKISEDAAALFTGLGHIHALMWLDIFDFNSFELSVLLFKVRPRVCLLSALVNSGELLVVRRMSRALWALPGKDHPIKLLLLRLVGPRSPSLMESRKYEMEGVGGVS